MQEVVDDKEPSRPFPIGGDIGGRPIDTLLSPFFDLNATTFNLTSFNPEEFTNKDVLVYGCSPSGLYAALRLLEPQVTMDELREDVVSAVQDGLNFTVVILEPTYRCGGRLMTASPPNMSEFKAELGDLGYHYTPSSYANVLVNYLGLEVHEVSRMVNPSNIMYLRGRHLRQRDAKETVKDLYSLSYIERDQEAADLLMMAIESIIPGAFSMNETDWQRIFYEGHQFNGVELYNLGFWNLMSQVLSGEALQFVKDYYGSDALFLNNMNALESIVTIVLANTSELKAPVEGMEMFVTSMYNRFLALGGQVAFGIKMLDMAPAGNQTTNITSPEVSVTPEEPVVTEIPEILPPVDTNLTIGENSTLSNATRQDPPTAGELSGVAAIPGSASGRPGPSLGVPGARRLQVEIVNTTLGVNSTEIPRYDVTVMDSNGEFFTLKGFSNVILATSVAELSKKDSSGLPNLLETSTFFTEDPTLKKAIDSRVPVSYTRLYLCYMYPWWENLNIAKGRSSTCNPLREIVYLDHACLLSNTDGFSSAYWNAMLMGSMATTVVTPSINSTAEEDINVLVADPSYRWQTLAAPTMIVKEAQRLLKLMHDVSYIPEPLTAMFVSSEQLGSSTSAHQFKIGYNPMETAAILSRPQTDGNVFMIGESVTFPYLTLEADLRSAENLLQQYFFKQPEMYSFDVTGNLLVEGKSRNGASISISADGTRLGLVSYMDGLGDVTLYQRFGDEVLGIWKEIGNNFMRKNVPVVFSMPNSTDPFSQRKRRLVERVDTNVTNVVLSGDGMFMALSAIEEQTGLGYVQLFHDSGEGNWTKIGEDLVHPTEDAQFGYSIDLSYDGKILAVGAPNADDYGQVYVYNCSSMQTCVQVGKAMNGIEGVSRYGSSVSLSYDGKVVAAGAPNEVGLGLFGYASVFAFVQEWTQVGSVLSSSASVEDDQFGFSVSLAADGSAVAVGAPGSGAGSATIFSYDLGSRDWREDGVFEGTNDGDNVGFDVALSGDSMRLLVGAPQIDTNSSGYVLSYEAEYDAEGLLSTWSEYGTPLQGQSFGDFFGYSVVLSFDGSKLAVGAPEAADGAGAVSTLLYVTPSKFNDSELLARMLWEESTNGTYPWPNDLECIPSPVDDDSKATRALGVLALLRDERLTTDIEPALLFNLYDGVTHLDRLHNCTTLLGTVDDILTDESLDSSIAKALEIAMRAYLGAMTGSPTITPTPAPSTTMPVAVPTTPPNTVSPTPEFMNNITVGNTTAEISPVELDAVAIRVLYNGDAWVGLGFSKLGEMIDSTAVIGEPDSGTVRKYYLARKNLNGILNADQLPTDLLDSTITQEGGVTIMDFVKLLNEGEESPSEIPLNASGNSQFIYAFGRDNTLNYHGPDNRGAFLLDLGKCDTGACTSDNSNYDSQEIIVGTRRAPIFTVYFKKVSSLDVIKRRRTLS